MPDFPFTSPSGIAIVSRSAPGPPSATPLARCAVRWTLNRRNPSTSLIHPSSVSGIQLRIAWVGRPVSIDSFSATRHVVGGRSGSYRLVGPSTLAGADSVGRIAFRSVRYHNPARLKISRPSEVYRLLPHPRQRLGPPSRVLRLTYHA